MKEFAEKLVELRAEKGISQAKLAATLGISNGTIAFWETNKSEPTAPNIVLVANFFGVSSDYLLGIKDDFST